MKSHWILLILKIKATITMAGLCISILHFSFFRIKIKEPFQYPNSIHNLHFPVSLFLFLNSRPKPNSTCFYLKNPRPLTCTCSQLCNAFPLYQFLFFLIQNQRPFIHAHAPGCALLSHKLIFIPKEIQHILSLMFFSFFFNVRKYASNKFSKLYKPKHPHCNSQKEKEKKKIQTKCLQIFPIWSNNAAILLQTKMLSATRQNSASNMQLYCTQRKSKKSNIHTYIVKMNHSNITSLRPHAKSRHQLPQTPTSLHWELEIIIHTAKIHEK